MKLKHLLGVAAATVTVGAGVIVGLPQVALAHTPAIDDTCTQLKVDLTAYEGNSTNNRVTVTIDGAAQVFNFSTSFHQTFGWSQTANHTWTVVVDANRNSGNATAYDRTFTGTQTACYPPQSTTVSWTPTNGTCANPQGSLAVNAGANATYDAGSSPAGPYNFGQTVSGSFTAKPGYVIQGTSSFGPHQFGVTGSPCQLQSNPNVTLEKACGSWSAQFTNAVSGIDPWEFVPDATFTLDIDGATETITVAANTVVNRNGTFPEDFGSHIVSVGAQSLTVDTDCTPNEILPPQLSAAYDCVSQTSSYTLTPESDANWTAGAVTLDGNTYSVTITPKPGFTFGAGANQDGTFTRTATFVVSNDCVIQPPALSAVYDCVAQNSSATLTPATSDTWTAGEITLAGGTYSVTITPNEGHRFANPGQDGTVTLTAIVQIIEDCERTVAQPQVTPPTCSEPGTVVLPPSVDYTWTTNDDGTYTATATDGIRLVGQTTFGPFAVGQLTGEQCVVPTIDLAAFSPVCQSDTPYISYEIKVSGTPNTDATLTFFDLDGKQVAQYVDVPLTGKVIYPGASINPPDWPGWKLNSVGLWEIDPTDARLRDGLSVKVEVNPTATAKVSYPPATEKCSDPDQVQSQAPPTTVQVVTLPSTGSGSSVLAGVATLLLAAGGALILMVRRPRQT